VALAHAHAIKRKTIALGAILRTGGDHEAERSQLCKNVYWYIIGEPGRNFKLMRVCPTSRQLSLVVAEKLSCHVTCMTVPEERSLIYIMRQDHYEVAA
jgi:hypothetical protein